MIYTKPLHGSRSNAQLKPDKIARFYYHITRESDWGEEITLNPIGGNNGNRAFDEPKNARTCVAPSIENCLCAIVYGDADPYYIYRTKEKVIAYWPYQVEDATLTRERWIINPQSFILVGTLEIGKFVESREIDRQFSLNDSCGSYEDVPHQREVLKAWKSALKTNKCGGLKI